MKTVNEQIIKFDEGLDKEIHQEMHQVFCRV